MNTVSKSDPEREIVKQRFTKWRMAERLNRCVRRGTIATNNYHQAGSVRVTWTQVDRQTVGKTDVPSARGNPIRRIRYLLDSMARSAAYVLQTFLLKFDSHKRRRLVIRPTYPTFNSRDCFSAFPSESMPASNLS